MLVLAINSVIKMIMALDTVASLVRPRPHAATPTKGPVISCLIRLNGPAAHATLAGDLQDAFAGAQLRLDALFNGSIDPRPAELLALRYGALKAGMNTLPDHAALKLGECTADLKHQLAGRRGRVDRLLVEVQIDAAGVQGFDDVQQVSK